MRDAEAHSCIITQIVEDDFGGAPARVGRSASTTNVGSDARPGSSAGAAEGGRLAVSAAALLPALKEVASGLGTQYDLMKELVHAVQARHWRPLLTWRRRQVGPSSAACKRRSPAARACFVTSVNELVIAVYARSQVPAHEYPCSQQPWPPL